MNINNLIAMLENGIAKLRDPATPLEEQAKILEVMGGLTRTAREQVTTTIAMKELENA